ncbi:hypothetical protein [Brevundimonas mediterranea]|uniref:Uncharacterized protein n=1 Tax=Brevundimonas mediterranea TaxID=74329 RepID=A0A7W6F164_9CAUL|nr:hypothetical protein [Brevundimonas mediterranea]MBB3873508.1 hypothetical protein [Brevundimonas mediterranea]
MGLVTWTAVFALPNLRDAPEDVAASLNGLIGADLQRKVRPLLAQSGWNFEEAWPEDHGWHSEAAVIDEGKTIVASFVTSPEVETVEPNDRAPDDRWRIVIGLDVGMFAKTKARRSDLLRALARDAETACCTAGARGFVWEYGGSETSGLAKAW